MLGADPMARQAEVEREAGRYGGERKFGAAANLPARVGGGSSGAGRSSAGRAPATARSAEAGGPRKPTDADMGPHNFGGGEGKPAGGGLKAGMRGRKPSLDEMGPGREEAPAGGEFVRPERPDPGVSNWRKGRGGGRITQYYQTADLAISKASASTNAFKISSSATSRE